MSHDFEDSPYLLDEIRARKPWHSGWQWGLFWGWLLFGHGSLAFVAMALIIMVSICIEP